MNTPPSKENFPDRQTLLEHAGKTTFNKGLALFNKGAVKQVRYLGDGVQASVQGSYLYRVQYHLGLDGFECNCPAAEYQYLCKHGVALGLYCLAHPQDDDSKSDEQTIREFLTTYSQPQLIDLVVGMLAKDNLQWHRILAKAELADDDLGVNELKRIIEVALEPEDLWDWQEVRDYFTDAEAQLELLWEQLPKHSAEQQWALLEQGLLSLNRALEQVDDSAGHRFDIQGELCSRMVEVFKQLPWSLEQQAQWLFSLLESDNDVSPSLDDFALSPELLGALAERCEAHLEEIREQLEDVPSWRLRRFVAPLLRRSQNRQDWREELRVRSLIARNSNDYLQLSKLCVTYDDALDAEYWLQKARSNATPFELRACDELAVKIKLELGENKAAWQLAWQLFEQRPRFSDYQELAKLHQQLNQPMADFIAAVEPLLATQGDALLAFYLEQEEIAKARLWAQANPASERLKLALADKIIVEHTSETITLYLTQVKAQIEQTHNEAYAYAAELLKQLRQNLLSHKLPLDEFNQMVENLALEYRRKRNMLAILKANFLGQ
ncbi:SWIM zinc finger family protein [Aliagarivorans taiwanensis]|uniref:SWIM zinc finger family protein n=1 Tax=Aliagarivorans taiwanensis TaxID=561966 RepID=UPI00042A2353|nr:SWIM zinc finger domain-containing protein [Aliagarivorans taiwanensis]